MTNYQRRDNELLWWKQADTPAACLRGFVYFCGWLLLPLVFRHSSVTANFSRKNALFFRHIFLSSHVSWTFPVAFVCVRVLIFALRAFHSLIFFSFLPAFLSFQLPVPRFESTMRTQSFLLAFLFIVMSFCKSLLSGLMHDRRAD